MSYSEGLLLFRCLLQCCFGKSLVITHVTHLSQFQPSRAQKSWHIFKPKFQTNVIAWKQAALFYQYKQGVEDTELPALTLIWNTEGERQCLHVIGVVFDIPLHPRRETGSATYSPKPTQWQMGVRDSSTGPPLLATFSLRQHRATKLALAAYRMWLGATSQCVTPRATADCGTLKERQRGETQFCYDQNHSSIVHCICICVLINMNQRNWFPCNQIKKSAAQ